MFKLKGGVNFFDKYIGFFLRRGLKKKTKLHLLAGFSFFFSLFSNNAFKWALFQSRIDILKSGLFLNFNFFKVNLILEFVTNLLNPVFDVECHDDPKTYKKKSKRKHSFKIKYLSYGKRNKRALK
jgi:hypothetical protein